MSRRALLDEVWRGVVVGEEVLTHSIAELRRQLGDSSRSPSYIETVHKAGYRLLVQVDVGEQAISCPPPFEPLEHDTSVAVLPLSVLDSDARLEAFAAALREEILDRLACLRGVRVVLGNPAAGAESHDIDLHVEGSIRGSGGSARISVRLADRRCDRYAWSQSYQQGTSDATQLQRQIASEMATAIRSRAVKAPANGGSASQELCEGPELQAYLVSLEAHNLLFRGGKENIRGAVELFSNAVALDPRSAQARAGLAISLIFLFMYYEPLGHHLERALEAATTAVGLDPRLATSRAALGWVLSSAGAFGEATASFMTAVRLEPSAFGPHYLFGRACFSEGRFELAAAVLERAGQIHSEDFHAWLLAAKARRSLGDEARALAAHRKALSRVEAYLESEPDDLRAICDKACCLVELGQVDQAMAWAEPHGELSDPMVYYLACAFARAGEVRPALDCLERIVETGWSHPGWLRSDPDLDSLRNELRFQRIERALGLH